MTIYMCIATASWLLLTLGLMHRFDRAKHVPMMVTGIAIDVALVLFLQITRSAVQTALSLELSIFEHIHIGCSTLALVLYLPSIYFGRALLLGDDSVRSKHKKVAVTAYFFRTIGFVFMFSMWKN